ncbi:hypothetical protein SKAU_G00072790 [Synaphobranchus kaupii]|uniref:Uncharacterized protein n=1 Tax=Synaphobranchus kaupii TaxID=118154 RepID=A0A9Q1G731_SYNKA|nr:hypothetical protein SKAU_G00072790 [Synaphobranchus kaupii]
MAEASPGQAVPALDQRQDKDALEGGHMGRVQSEGRTRGSDPPAAVPAHRLASVHRRERKNRLTEVSHWQIPKGANPDFDLGLTGPALEQGYP